MLQTCTLPVTTTFEDKPIGLAKDIVSVSYSKNQLYAGALSTADISTANIGTIYFGDLTVGSHDFEFDVTNLNGISVLDGTKKITAKVTVSNSYSEHKVRINKDDIIIEGAEQGSKLSVKSIDSTIVTVLAPKKASINSSNLTLKCDVSKKNDKNQYPIEIIVSNSKAWVYGKYYATIE